MNLKLVFCKTYQRIGEDLTVTASSTNTPLALDLNGNTLAEVGSYTDEDGNEHIMGDLHLAADRLHSRYSNSIPLTDEQQQEVNLRGSGRLRDLREAAAQSSELAEVLLQYKNTASKAE